MTTYIIMIVQRILRLFPKISSLLGDAGPLWSSNSLMVHWIVPKSYIQTYGVDNNDSPITKFSFFHAIISLVINYM